MIYCRSDYLMLASRRAPGFCYPGWWRMGLRLRVWIGGHLLALAAATAADTTNSFPILANLSFDELSQVQIITASRAPEPLWKTAAAVSVLTTEDIQHSGATSLPEALRWVPGLNVAQITANTWAVGARGFQWQYANKLLVMIDGRSVYSPTSGGVRWEDNAVYLDDVDRIEVVRGPGSSVWGANAVNGVINIVSKSAFDTLGTEVFAGAGNELLGYTGARQGIKLSEDTAIRFYGMFREADDNVLVNSGGTAADDSARFGQGGFRLDWHPSEENQFTLQGDVFAHRTEYTRTFTTLMAPPTYSVLSEAPIENHGANVIGRWRHEWSGQTYLEWQNYWDWHHNNRPQNTETLHTLDTDLVFGTTLGERHEITSGLGYRFRTGELGPKLYNFVPAQLETHLFSTFLQDQITLAPERWALTLGAKLEHNTFTGWEPQPTARLAFTPSKEFVVWTSVARAVRTPTWVEEIGALDARVFPPGVFDPALPAAIRIFGNPDLKSERLTAYEIGARWKLADRLTLDATGFYYDYDNYVLIANLTTTNQTAPPAQVLATQYQNGIQGESYGGEIALHWEPVEGWQLLASYSYVQIQLHTTQSDPFQFEQDELTTPDHTIRLQSSLQLGRQWQFDLGGRYVDAVPYYGIPDYFELNARLAWTPNRHWQIALAGQNLLHDSHPEYDSALSRRLTGVERSVYLLCRWTY